MWLETRSVIGQTSEWEVFGFTDGGAPSHLLSSGNESNREQFYAPEHRPVSVDDERAYVTALFPPQGDEAMHYPKILSVPLSGGSPQVHVENGYHPMATDDGLYFLRSGVVGTKRVPTELWFWARGSAEPRLVQELTTSKDEQVFSVCVTADVRAWVITGFGATTERVMIQRGDEEPKSITLNGGGSESRISCGDGIVGWDGGSDDGGEYVYSVADDVLWKVEEMPRGDPALMLAGRTVAWRLPGEMGAGDVPDFRGYLVARWL